jgi:hypothetical protein
VLEQWSASRAATRALPAAGRDGGAEADARSSSAKADTTEEPDRITVNGKPYDCTRVTTVLTYPDGRKESKMINWFAKDVLPFPASRSSWATW